MALEAILAHKRAEVAARKSAATLEAMLVQAAPTTRRLTESLRAHPGFILEVKFASPSGGVIRPGADLDPVLESYGRHADAISVLTDERFFGGSLARLAEVRQRVTQPILCKDFILEPFQIAEARLHGADAVLLILAAIDDAAWRACSELAGRLGMDVLTEVHDETEAGRAIALGAKLIGINNRNLHTLEVDLSATPRLAPRFGADHVLVAESGIASRESVLALRSHVDAFLVGSALMREDQLDRAVRRLVYGRTKICGLTTPGDAQTALAAGATHGGLMFAAASPRRVSLEVARRLAAAAPLAWVGVFADQPPGDIAATAACLPLAAVQLHGSESAEGIARVRALVPEDIEVWKAVRVRERIEGGEGADRLLLDGYSEGRLGGTGARFDWSLLDGHPRRREVILAGGITPDNVAEAAALGTWAVDASSGVESGPGQKDAGLLAQFFRRRRRLPARGALVP